MLVRTVLVGVVLVGVAQEVLALLVVVVVLVGALGDKVADFSALEALGPFALFLLIRLS